MSCLSTPPAQSSFACSVSARVVTTRKHGLICHVYDRMRAVGPYQQLVLFACRGLDQGRANSSPRIAVSVTDAEKDAGREHIARALAYTLSVSSKSTLMGTPVPCFVISSWRHSKQKSQSCIHICISINIIIICAQAMRISYAFKLCVYAYNPI